MSVIILKVLLTSAFIFFVMSILHDDGNWIVAVIGIAAAVVFFMSVIALIWVL